MSDRFTEGIARFDRAEFWEAHEAWEACWLAAEGDARVFYQALILTAAALVKWQQGNAEGVTRNWAKAQQRLALLPATYASVDLAALAAHMEALVNGSRRDAPRIPMAR